MIASLAGHIVREECGAIRNRIQVRRDGTASSLASKRHGNSGPDGPLDGHHLAQESFMRHTLNRRVIIAVMSGALASTALVDGAAAQTAYRHGHRHHAHYVSGTHHAHRYSAYAYRDDDGNRGLGYTNPAYGYSEAPYDPSYTGPGAIIFNATRRAAQEPGVTNELSPDAKETATGGPVGGVPGFDGT
jgi:hypothetical protein